MGAIRMHRANGHLSAPALFRFMLPSLAIRRKPPMIPEYHIYIAGILSWIAR
jgi:hypothetical protein